MITVQVDDTAVRTWLSNMPEKVHEKLRNAVDKIAILLQNKVRNDKLAGQVLKYHTHNLQQSIQRDIEDNASRVMGSVFSNESLAPYAAIHEFGGSINHPGGTAYFIGKDKMAVFVSNKIANAYGNWARTKAHIINMPERSFLRSSLDDMKETIVSDLKEAVKEGME